MASITRTDNHDYGGAKRLLSYTVQSAGDYKFTFDYTAAGSPTLKIERVSASSSNYSLTGWLNGASVTTTDNSRKFTKQQDGTYIYTLDYTFTGNQGGAQYVTIFDGTNAYHPVTHKSGTGTAGTTVNTSPGADPSGR